MGTLRRWWYIPLVALLGLLVKGLLLTFGMAVPAAKDASIDALAGAGLGDAVAYKEVSGVSGMGADGLNVVLEGPAANEAAAVAAVEAEGAVNSVRYIPTDDGEEATPETTTSTVAPAAPQLDPAQVSLAAAGGAIVLNGIVADDATRDSLVSTANAEYGEANVTDNLTVNADGYTNDGGQLVITGQAESENQQSDWQSQGKAVAVAGSLEFIDQTTVRPVEESLNAIFELEPIEFERNSAVITEGSLPTIQAAAVVINDNPSAGNLRVVGHTDSDGSESSNASLSTLRAEAVVDYLVKDAGVDAARLVAEGRGETELLVSPEETPEDKQRNRRIAWEIN